MQFRLFGKTDVYVSEVGLGCWQIGSDWGSIDEQTSREILNTAVDHEINFFDTADVYGMGKSERLIGEFLAGRKEKVFVATKVGRTDDLYPDQYNESGVRSCVEASLKRLGVESLDLIQLHCVPRPVLENGEIFHWLRKLREEGKIKHFGASVESVDEALLCMQHDDLCSLQIIFNIFRQKPIEQVLPLAKSKKVAIIVRLPLASGLLTGKFDRNTKFPENDHRNYNRDGQAFNVGETFAGLPFEKGVELTGKLKNFVPEGMTMSQMAIRWILDFDAVSVVIPGASRARQVIENAVISNLPPLSDELHKQLKEFYEQEVEAHIRGPY